MAILRWKQLENVWLYLCSHQQDSVYSSSAEKMYLVCCLADCLWKSDRCQRERQEVIESAVTTPLSHVCAFMTTVLLPILGIKKVCVIMCQIVTAEKERENGRVQVEVWCRRQTGGSEGASRARQTYNPHNTVTCSDRSD